MKRVLLAGIALTALATGAMAADLSPYYKAPLIGPAFTWGGFYVGANAGYAWSNDDVALGTTSTTSGQQNGSSTPTRDTLLGAATAASIAASVPGNFATSPHGFLGGGQLGYNFQSGWFVYGVEADLDQADIKGSESLTGVGTATGPVFPFRRGTPIALTSTTSAYAEQNLDWFGTVRGRLGFTVWDRLLIYGTGGFAYGEGDSTANYSTVQCANFHTRFIGLTCSNSNTIVTGPTDAGGSGSSGLTGWVYGAGLEYAFLPGWSVKAEWLHYDLGTLDYSLSPSVFTFQAVFGSLHTHTVTTSSTASANYEGDLARIGLNYKFW